MSWLTKPDVGTDNLRRGQEDAIRKELERERLSTPARPKASKRRHRPPDGIPKETVKRMMWELGQRKAKLLRHPEFTQAKIGARLGLSADLHMSERAILQRARGAAVRSRSSPRVASEREL